MNKEELFKIDNVVEYFIGWHFPDGKSVLDKAKRLVKNGYRVMNYDGNEISLDYIKGKVK